MHKSGLLWSFKFLKPTVVITGLKRLHRIDHVNVFSFFSFFFNLYLSLFFFLRLLIPILPVPKSHFLYLSLLFFSSSTFITKFTYSLITILYLSPSFLLRLLILTLPFPKSPFLYLYHSLSFFFFVF